MSREPRVSRLSVLWGLFAHGATEEFCQLGIEGDTGLLLNLLQSFVDRKGGSFRLFGGQVVKYLGDRDNASEQGYAVLSQGKRVSGSVPSFVMEGDNLHGIGR